MLGTMRLAVSFRITQSQISKRYTTPDTQVCEMEGQQRWRTQTDTCCSDTNTLMIRANSTLMIRANSHIGQLQSPQRLRRRRCLRLVEDVYRFVGISFDLVALKR